MGEEERKLNTKEKEDRANGVLRGNEAEGAR